MIRTENLTRRFGEKEAVAGLNLRVEPGEILGFLGPNGAGKTTTVNMLTGLLRPTSGKALVSGFDVVEAPMEVKRRIGYVPETAALYEALTAAEYLELVACLHHMDLKVAAARRNDLMDLFGLGSVQDQRLTEFSKVMRQKVVMVAALQHRPEVLFLDEPFDGLDANAAAVAKELLKRLAEQGRTVLFCSHILEVVERVCARIVIIDKGRAIAEGTAEAIRRSVGAATLEAAFTRLTGVRDVGDVASDLVAALDRS